MGFVAGLTGRTAALGVDWRDGVLLAIDEINESGGIGGLPIELGTVSPGRFISVAEEANLIIPIGKWAIRTACKQGNQWQKTHPCVLPLI